MAERAGLHRFCGDCGTCKKTKLDPGQVVATHRHPRDDEGKRRTEQRLFRGMDPVKNWNEANKWKDIREGKTATRNLPKGISSATVNGRPVLYATVPAWADTKRPRRTFPVDDLDRAVAWLVLATEARSAEPPLPLPPVPPREASNDAGPSAAAARQKPPTLFGELALRWMSAYYDEAEESGELRNGRRRKTIRQQIDDYILGGLLADGSLLGTVRLADLNRAQHFTGRSGILRQMANRGLTNTQKNVIWIIRQTCEYGFRQGWMACDPTGGQSIRMKMIKPSERAVAERAGTGVKSGRPRPYVPPRVFAQVLRRITDVYGEEFALAAALQYYCGALRPAESLGLAMGDVDRTRHLLEITKQAGVLRDVKDDDGNTVQTYWCDVTKTAAGARFCSVPDMLWPIVDNQYEKRLSEGAQAGDAFLLPDLMNSYALLNDALEFAGVGLIDQAGPHWKELAPYDLRHQAITNYARAGVPDDVRSYLVGHADDEDTGMTRRKRKSPRGATITRTLYTHVYTSRRPQGDDMLTEWDVQLVQAAGLLNDYVLRHLDGCPVIAYPEPTDDAEWLTVKDAAEYLGVSVTSVHSYQKNGVLGSRRLERGQRWRDTKALARSAEDRTQVVQVRRADVEALLEQRAGVVGLADATAVLGVSTPTIKVLAKEMGLPIHRNPGLALGDVCAYLDAEDYGLLAKAVNQGKDFRANHLCSTELVSEFGIPRALVKRLETCGVLARVDVVPRTAAMGVVGRRSTWYEAEPARRALREFLKSSHTARRMP